MKKVLISALAITLTLVASAAHAQVTTGNVRGIVTDPNGAVVPSAQVTITKKSTNISNTTQTTGSGEFQFTDLLPADDYSITIEAANFKKLTIDNVKVQLNQTTNLSPSLTVGGTTETVTVTAGGAELVDTTTQNLAKSFTDRQVVELAQTSTGLGVYNLALIAPNVSSSGGVGVGSGGSVGGQRPRNNNFVVDGIDNNDKSVTGPQVYISPETVGEFTLLQNQYSAEFARSTGGQFILATKSGTNDFHGTGYFFGRNRRFNAIDTLNKQPGNVFVRDPSDVNEAAGVLRQPRSDYFRTGVNVGGPIIKNKLFFFGSFERIGRGDAAGTSFFAPTAAGYATLATIPGLSAANLNLLKQFVPAAASASDSVTVSGLSIPIGSISLPAPNFFERKNYVANVDWTQTSKTQHRFRFIKNDEGLIDTAATLPIFFTLLPTKQYLFSYTNIHSFTQSLTNEVRLAFRRSDAPVPVPNVAFPLAGFGSDFPNVSVDELGVDIGPDPNAPQFTIENNYQVIDNVTWLKGNHSIKFGGDFRKLIAPESFVQRQRGDYDWGDLNSYLHDLAPDFGERNVGANTYYGNQRLLFGFVQDDWRFRPNLTLNLGLNYSWQEVPFGAKQQNLNAISTVPGLLDFHSPKSQTKNFAPRVGFAYSPNYTGGWMARLFGNQGQTSIRAGFSMAYDVIFDNIYILSSPPQFQQTVDCNNTSSTDSRCPAGTYLGHGGIANVVLPTGGNAAAARAATGTFIPDQQVPYAITYTGSIQRQFMKDWSLELRYLGTRGVHLLTQNRINVTPRVFNSPGNFLPTLFTAPTQAQLDAMTTTLSQLQSRSIILPQYSAAGFTNPVVAFLSNGNSIYHGASASLTHRFTQNYQMSASYTWSHLIDDTTAEVFSTILSPRRVQDFQNLRSERADSALDRRQRFVVSSLYTMPYFSKSENHLVRLLLGGFNFAGTLTLESGEKATIRSGVDSNLNGDNAGDRSILNPTGTPGTASRVTALTRTDGQTVAYLVVNPSAQYIQAGPGAFSNTGRNTMQLPGIRNVDFSIFKNFHITEGKYFQLRADLFNAFNHPQWTPGSVNGAELTSITGGPASNINNINALASGVFNRPDLVYSSHPRVIQLAARFNF
ncbi:MAG TPA: carboxypeptidase regulatory-like domain-containing protein [Pyrinomonadaceae bacterium]|nr:carboxypeptidase regulatory-like domain-containing protein [Pyrinomonadaceae bacterium]